MIVFASVFTRLCVEYDDVSIKFMVIKQSLDIRGHGHDTLILKLIYKTEGIA